MTASSIDVNDKLYIGGNKIMMGDGRSGGFINLGHGSKIQAVGPNNLSTTLANDGLVITDNDVTINCNMTHGFSFSDSAASVEITNTDIVARGNSNRNSTKVTSTGVTVVDDSSGAQVECTTAGIDLAGGGYHNSIDNIGMVVEDPQSNQAQVYSTSIAVRDNSGNESRMENGTIYAVGSYGT